MKTKRMSTLLVASVVTCSLLCGCIMGGCSAKPTPVNSDDIVLTVADESASLSELALVIRYQQALVMENYQQLMIAYGQSVSVGQTLWGVDVTQEEADALTQDMQAKGLDVGFSVQSEADKLQVSMAYVLAQQLAAVAHADEFQVILTESEKSEIQDVAKTFVQNSDAEALSLNGITQQTVEDYLTDFTLSQKVEVAYKAAQDVQISDEDALMMKVSAVCFMVNPSDESYNDAKKVHRQAESYRAALTADTDMEHVNETYSNAMFVEDGLPVHAQDGDTIFAADDIAAISKLKAGEVYEKVLEVSDGSSSGWYVLRMVAPEEATMTAQYRKELTNRKLAIMYDDQLSVWMKDGKVSCDISLLKSVQITDDVQYLNLQEKNAVHRDVIVGDDTIIESDSAAK